MMHLRKRCVSETSDQNATKLILYFDIRNTILVADSVANVTIEQCLNSYLTSVAWGHIDPITNKWQWVNADNPQPTIERPDPTAVSYYKFAELNMTESKMPRFRFRRLMGNFTNTEIGAPFRPLFEKTLASLRYPHEYNAYLSMKGDNGDNFHYILPAFFELLHYLRRENLNFTVVLRTYGLDGPNALCATSLMAAGTHMEFESIPDLRIDHNTAKLTRATSQGIEKFALRHAHKVYRDEKHIHDFFMTNQNHIIGVIDDFHYWQDHNFVHEAGKPCWFDKMDAKHMQIFFDDNIRLPEQDSIVNARVFNTSYNASRSLTNEEMQACANLVQVDLLQAIQNRNYYVEHVRRMLAQKTVLNFAF